MAAMEIALKSGGGFMSIYFIILLPTIYPNMLYTHQILYTEILKKKKLKNNPLIVQGFETWDAVEVDAITHFLISMKQVRDGRGEVCKNFLTGLSDSEWVTEGGYLLRHFSVGLTVICLLWFRSGLA